LDGIVLSGSLDRRQNFPVSIGQTPYEIAPIDPLRVELSVSAEEIIHVEIGQPVKFRFDGFGTETIEGLITRVQIVTTLNAPEKQNPIRGQFIGMEQERNW
jgi:hypothetical protein